MNEDFVSFELAKKLKEKGYPQKPCNMNCMPYYEYDEVANYAALCNEMVWHLSTEPRDNIFAAPAIHKVLKWLREEKKIHVATGCSAFSYWRFVIMYTDDRAKLEPTISVRNKNSCEDAYIAGIEYVLDNLI